MNVVTVRDDTILLSERMDVKDLKIDNLIIAGMRNCNNAVHSTIKSIQEKGDHRLNHLTIAHEISSGQRRKLLDELKCKSITTFELKDYIIDVDGNHWTYDNNDQVLFLFKQLYENIHQLLFHQIVRNNNLCLPRDKLYTYFYIHDSKENNQTRRCVFGATNVQMK